MVGFLCSVFLSLRRHYFAHEKLHLANRTNVHPSLIPDERVVDRLTETASSCEERDRAEVDRLRARERAVGFAGLAGKGCGLGLGLLGAAGRDAKQEGARVRIAEEEEEEEDGDEPTLQSDRAAGC